MRNFGFSMNIDRHGMSQLGQPAHGSRMYDNSAMEHLMRTVELMMKFREAKFDVVEAGLAANSEVISVNPVYLESGMFSSDVSVSFICVNVFSFEVNANAGLKGIL